MKVSRHERALRAELEAMEKAYEALSKEIEVARMDGVEAGALVERIKKVLERILEAGRRDNRGGRRMTTKNDGGPAFPSE